MLANMKVMKKISVALAALILTSLAIGVVNWRSMSQLQTTAQWTEHTHTVLAQMTKLSGAMVDQETGMRGYLLSGDEGFLAPKIAGAKAYAEALSEVRNLTSDNLAQQRRLDELDGFAQAWMTGVAAKEITLMKAPATQADARAMETSGHGKASMDALRAKAGEIANAEGSLLVIRAEESAAAAWMSYLTTIVGGLIMVVMAAVALFALNRFVVKPLAAVTVAMQAIARGALNVVVPGTTRGDEIGDAARAFEENAERIAAMNRTQIEKEAEAAVERKRMMLGLADQFEQAVGGIVGVVSSAATEMQATSQQLSGSAHQTSAQSNVVAAAAEEAGTNVSSVAAAAEELSASVSEIGRQVEMSADRAKNAVTEANATKSVVAELSEGASRIDGIVEMISGIANQTNLLALNATIEAARAGEHGRGFAIVAAEVKNLAGQTAKATGEISAQITAIKSATTQTVSAIEGIADTIRNINETSSSIALAVEEQGVATREIVQAIAQASQGAGEVSSNIVSVARAAEETGLGASQVNEASSELARQAETLRSEVNKFLATVRAA